MPDHLIAAPDTPLAREAGTLLDAECDRELAGHCRRSYQFAALIARAEAVEVDEEVLYLGTLLHDLGLARRHDGPERFDVRGANIVRELLLDHGMERARAENVWDVIALHAAGAIAQHKSPETRIANRGISVDIRGAGADVLPADAVRAVLDEWPRQDFPSAFTRLLVDEVRAHPDTVRFSWLESVAAAHVPGFEVADFLAVLRASGPFA
jgi:HD domain